MEASSSPVRWTWTEYCRLPMSGSTRYEVIADELAVTPSPTPRHQRIVLDLATALNLFGRREGSGQAFPGPVDVLLGEGDYVQPDLVFVRTARLHLVTDRGIEGPPDLVVEVLFPSTAGRDRGIKLDRYRHFGVPEYWIVDPYERVVEVWPLAAGAREPDVRRAPGVLRRRPGGTAEVVEVDLADLFRV